jgi:hypothetical protein
MPSPRPLGGRMLKQVEQEPDLSKHDVIAALLNEFHATSSSCSRSTPSFRHADRRRQLSTQLADALARSPPPPDR